MDKAQDVADWAVERAIQRIDASAKWEGNRWQAAEIRKDAAGKTAYAVAVMLLAEMIQAHEQPPVDHLYEALKAVIELGRYDTREQTELLRAELAKRGLALSAGRGEGVE